MSGASEFGKCDICGELKNLQRTYFEYNIKCECHSPNHFEVVHHCYNCIPIEPKETKIILNTSYLKNIEQEIRKEKLKKLNNGSI